MHGTVFKILVKTGKLKISPLEGLLCFLIGHLFHARPITFRNVCGPEAITSLCPVMYFLFHMAFSTSSDTYKSPFHP